MKHHFHLPFLTKYINNNIVSFNVFYSILDYTVIDQIPKMSVLDLISNIGGNLGLFISISFLSFAEIIELLVEIIYIFVYTNRSNKGDMYKIMNIYYNLIFEKYSFK